MADTNIRVRFLRAKRYPHPSGPRRAEGDEVIMDADLAEQWRENGIVEVVAENVDAPTTDTDADADADTGTEASDAERLADTNVSDLEAALADVDDPQVVRDAMDLDDRKGAQALYSDRLDELEGAGA